MTAPKIITLRCTTSESALAEFMISELDQPAQTRQSAITHPFPSKIPGFRDFDTLIVYGLAHTPTTV